jgi:hypothetical protein
MFSNDINHLVDRTPLDSPTLPSSPSPSALTQAHINEAISRSPDNGATLDLSHLGISDVGEEGAEELAAVGDEAGPPGQGPIVRYALLSFVVSASAYGAQVWRSATTGSPPYPWGWRSSLPSGISI